MRGILLNITDPINPSLEFILITECGTLSFTRADFEDENYEVIYNDISISFDISLSAPPFASFSPQPSPLSRVQHERITNSCFPGVISRRRASVTDGNYYNENIPCP